MKIIITALKIKEGGPLEILKEFIEIFINKGVAIDLYSNAEISSNSKYLRQIKITNYNSSYFHQLYWEYFGLKKIIQFDRQSILFAFDFMPNLDLHRRYLYYHNAIAFSTISLKEYYFDPRLFVQKFLLFFFSTLQIKKDDRVIVQQTWLKSIMRKKFHNVFVRRPRGLIKERALVKDCSGDFFFFYPALSRVFKNHELIIKAFNKITNNDLKLFLTINNNGSRYEKYLFNLAKGNKNIKFLGNIEHKQVLAFLQRKKCILLFPSKIESWGLPLSEAVSYETNIIALDKEYAHETLRKYKNVTYLEENPLLWFEEMQKYG